MPPNGQKNFLLNATFALSASVAFFWYLPATDAQARTFYRGHPWCERPVVSGAAKGGLDYRYNTNPPHTTSNNRLRSLDALQFLLHQADPEGGYRDSQRGRAPSYEVMAVMNYHRKSFSHSIQSPLVSVTTDRSVAEGYARATAQYNAENYDSVYPGEVLIIEVPDEEICDRDRWRGIIEASTGRRPLDPDHPVFRRCLVLQFPEMDSNQWAFLHEIPARYIRGSYPFPDQGPQFQAGCGASPTQAEIDDASGPRSRLRGKKSTSRQGASSGSYTKKRTLRLGKVDIDLTTLFKSAAEYLKSQFQSALQAKSEDIQGQFHEQVHGMVQEVYQDFLYWLNQTVHDELRFDEPIDSQAFETEFLNWINSPQAQIKNYIERYLREQSSTIGWMIDAYQNFQALQIADGWKAIWNDANDKYQRFTSAVNEAADMPDTHYSDILGKYGFSGEWVEQFRSYEGKFNTFNDRYRVVEGSQIMIGAFQSDVEKDKISGLFEMLDLMGAVAEESRIPIVSLFGQIVGEYGRIAKEMLSQVNALEDLIRSRHGYCLGAGVADNKRSKAYLSKPERLGTTICPTILSGDIYETIDPPQRIFFWVGNDFIEGLESGGGIDGVYRAMQLIKEAGEFDLYQYKGKENDISLIAKIYNTDYAKEGYGKGLPGLLREADETIGGIARRYASFNAGFALAGDNICQVDDIRKYLKRTTGLDHNTFAPTEENREKKTLDKLRALFAVSYIENRRNAAYDRYAKMWDGLKRLSFIRLHGTVRDARKPDQQCPRCAHASLDIAAKQATQLESCAVRQTDRHGSFIAYLLTDSLDFSIKLTAQVDDVHSETFTINKDTLDVQQLAFEDVFYFNMLIPIEESGPPDVETGAEQEPDPASDGVLREDLNKIIDLHEGAAGLVAHSQGIETNIGNEVTTVTRGLDQKIGNLTALESRVNALSKKASDIGGSVAAAQRRAEAAYQAAERAAAARSDVQNHALNCCTLAEQAKQSGERSRVNELVSQARLEDDQTRSGKTNYETNLTQSKTDLDSVLATKGGLEYFAGDKAKLKSEIQTEESAAGLMSSDAERFQILADEIMLDKNSLLNVIAQAGIVLEGAEKKKENRNLTPEDEKRLKQIKEYHGKIVALKKTIEGVYQNAGAMLRKPAQQVSQYHTKLEAIRNSFNAIGNVQLNPQALADLSEAAAHAQSSYDAAGVFADSVNDSAQKSAICLQAAEDHFANVTEPLTPEQACDKSFAGSVPSGEINDQGGYVCICPQGMQWNDENNRTHCVPTVQLTANELCHRDFPDSVSSGEKNDRGGYVCVCPEGMRWNDENNRTHCIAQNAQERNEQRTPEQICGNSFPNSVPSGSYDAEGRPSCECPAGMKWNDPNNRVYCLPASMTTPEEARRQPDDREVCTNQFPGSKPGPRDRTGNFQCFCPEGQKWNNPGRPEYCVSIGRTDTAQCNRAIQNILNAQFLNDRAAYDRGMAHARQIGCQVPPEVSGWKETQGGWGGRQGAGGQTGPGGGTSTSGTSGGGRGCDVMSDQLLGQGEAIGCRPAPAAPPPSR